MRRAWLLPVPHVGGWGAPRAAGARLSPLMPSTERPPCGRTRALAFRADLVRGGAALPRRRAGDFSCAEEEARLCLGTSTDLGAGGARVPLRGGTGGLTPLAKAGRNASIGIIEERQEVDQRGNQLLQPLQ